MSDWDVIAPEPIASGEEEDFEEEYLYDYGDYDYSYSDQEDDFYGNPTVKRISASSFQMPPMKLTTFNYNPKPRNFSKNRRADRLAYRHRTGDGIRKGHLAAGNEIADSISAYNEGYQSYNDRVLELREANADDLIPDRDRIRTDEAAGGGSKIIHITKVRKGTMAKYKGSTKSLIKNETINSKIDMDPKHYWDHVSHQLMEDGNFVQAKYDAFHSKAINERSELGIGQSAEMNSLYCFWCFFLREHFERDMYDEFLRLAREDIGGGSHYGIECFFRFCSYGLETHWMEDVFEDFENECMADYHRKNLYGMEKLKAFLVNQKHEFTIPVRPEIRDILARYPTMKSFREPQRRKQPMSQSGNRDKSRIPPKQRSQDKPGSTQHKEQPPAPATHKEQPPAPHKDAKDESVKPPRTNSKEDPRPPRANSKEDPKAKAPQLGSAKQPQPPMPGQRRQPPPQERQQEKQSDRRPQGGNRRGNRRQPGANLGWTFGRAQVVPSSAPTDSPMHRKF